MSTLRKLGLLSASLAGVALGISAFNVLTWPRGRKRTEPPLTRPEDVSVVIPARNEAAEIATCVQAVFHGESRPAQVVVCDDQSTDGTSEILARLQTTYPNLDVIEGQPLPDGWIGKPYACHQLTQAATQPVLCFVDADTKLTEQGLSRLLSLLDDLNADVVSAVPRQLTQTWFERWILPLLHLTYTSWLPMVLVYKSQDERFLAANGQVVLIRRSALDAIGGFESIRHELVDDMALGRRIKQMGFRFVFADGHHIAHCRMYDSPKGVWEGFSKNLYEGIGNHPLKLAALIGLYGSAFVLPYGLLAYGQWTKHPVATPAKVAVALNVALRGMLAIRYRQPAEGILLHPLGVLGLLGIAVNSARWHQRGQLHWRGRQYLPKAQR